MPPVIEFVLWACALAASTAAGCLVVGACQTAGTFIYEHFIEE